MNHPLTTALLALAAALAAVPALAEKADRDKPMKFESDALRYDDLKQINILTGNVVINKGTIQIRGARVDVKQDPEGYQYGVVVAEPGKRAFYRQKREGIDEWIEGESETIEYDGRADRVKFIGKAEMRRLRGATLADELNGSLITYDNTSDTFTVNGGAANAGVGNPNGRVKGVLAPKAAGQASAPAAPPAALRPSTTLGGDKQ